MTEEVFKTFVGAVREVDITKLARYSISNPDHQERILEKNVDGICGTLTEPWVLDARCPELRALLHGTDEMESYLLMDNIPDDKVEETVQDASEEILCRLVDRIAKSEGRGGGCTCDLMHVVRVRYVIENLGKIRTRSIPSQTQYQIIHIKG